MYLFPSDAQAHNQEVADRADETVRRDEATPDREDAHRPRDDRPFDVVVAVAALLVPVGGFLTTASIGRVTPATRPLLAGELGGIAIGLTLALVCSVVSGFTSRTCHEPVATPAKVWLYPLGVGYAWFAALYAIAINGSYLRILGGTIALTTIAFGVPLLTYVAGQDRPERVSPRIFWAHRVTAVNPTGARGWTYFQWATVIALTALGLLVLLSPSVRAASAQEISRLVVDIAPEAPATTPPTSLPSTGSTTASTSASAADPTAADPTSTAGTPGGAPTLRPASVEDPLGPVAAGEPRFTG